MGSDGHSSMLGGSASYNSQQGNSPDSSSGHIRNSEIPELAKFPADLDFVSQQQFITSQNIGMSPHTGQHPGFSDMKLLQQHLLYKQLQEFQRQQQLRQLDQGASQQSSHNQLSVAPKQAAINQLPALLNGVPISDISNHAQSNYFMGSESKIPSNPHMFFAGNANLTQVRGSSAPHFNSNGPLFRNDQLQAKQAMEIAKQQSDSSLYGVPVLSTRGSLNQNPRFQGISPDCADVMTKAGTNQVDKSLMQSAAVSSLQTVQGVKQQNHSQDCISVDEHRYQGKGFFENASVQSLNSNFLPANLRSVETLQINVQQQKDSDWSNDMHEKEVALPGSSHGGASLDPTEEKILFGTGDDDTWGTPFGSWSALVEDVVRGSSEDKGFDEQWNCFNPKTGDPTIGKHSSMMNDNEKQLASVNTNMQNTPLLTSESFPLLNSNSNRHVTPNFLHSSTQFMYEQVGKELMTASHESLQQSLEEAKNRQFDQSHTQKQFVEAGFHVQVHGDNVTNEHTHGQSMNLLNSSVSERNRGNKQSMWTHHQNLPMPTTRNQHSNVPNRWNANEFMVHSRDGTSNFHDNQNINHPKQGSETKKIMGGNRGYDGSMQNIAGNHLHLPGEEPKCDTYMSKFSAVDNSSFLEMNQNTVSRHQVDEEHAIFGSSVITKDGSVGICQRQGSMGPRASDSHPNNNVDESCKTSRSKQEHAKIVSNEDYAPYYSRHDECTDNKDVDRDNSLLISSQPGTSARVSGKSSRKVDGQNVANQGLHDHPMGNLRMNVEPANSPSYTSYSQGLPHSVIEGSANKEQFCIGDTQFVGRVVSDDAPGIGKEQFSDSQRNKEVDDMQSRGAIPSEHLTTSFGGSTPNFPHIIMRGQTSQNMLELLQKVDQSRDSENLAHFGFPEQNMVSGIPKVAAIDGSSSPQHSQSSSGLRLGPPYQRQLFSSHTLPSQTSINDFNALQGSDTGKHQKRSTSASSVHSMATSREVSQRENSVHSMVTSPEVSQRENWINRSSGKLSKDTSNSNNQGNIIAVAASDPSHKDEQKMQQNVADAPGYQVIDQSRHSFESHDQVIADHSIQESLPSMIGRIPPFRLPSSGNHSPASQFQPPNNGRSQPVDARFYHVLNSSQQLPILDTSSFSQMPAASGMPSHAGHPTPFHNVWTSVSAQERLPGAQPHKFTPHKLDPMIMSTNRRGTNSWALQKADDRIDKGRSPSEFGTCSTSSHQLTCKEDHHIKGSSSQGTLTEKVVANITKEDSSLGQESVPKHHRAGNSPFSISSLVRQHQQDSSKGNHMLDLSQNSQTEHVITSSSGGISLHGHAPKQSDGQLHNYSLLQQMQTMKGTDLDPMVGKTKGPDSSSDTLHMDRESGQKPPFGQRSVFRYPVDDQVPKPSDNSFQSDTKMLSFSSRENEVASANPSSLLIGTEFSYRDKYSSWQQHIQNNTQSLGMSSKSNFMGGIKHSQISPQMAPSWFEQYGTCMNSQIPDTHESQRIVEDGSQQDIFVKVPERIDHSCVLDQRTSVDHGGSLRQTTSPTTMAAAESFFLPSDIVDHNIVPKSKKRKSATSMLLPWHKEVTQASRSLQTISMVELDWAQVTNRLIDKVEDGFELIDGVMLPRAKRRLILTTQLMQQLLPPVPAAFLSKEATLAYESVTYFVAKTALVDACSMISYSKSYSNVHTDNENTISESLQKSEKAGGQVFLNAVESFNERSRKLQTDLSRLATRASMLDIRMECQELERFSIVNRLGKFHGSRGHTGVGSSSTFGTALGRTFPQRQVTALPMPRNLPEGVSCLSL